jgi:hypothetical protein
MMRVFVLLGFLAIGVGLGVIIVMVFPDNSSPVVVQEFQERDDVDLLSDVEVRHGTPSNSVGSEGPSATVPAASSFANPEREDEMFTYTRVMTTVFWVGEEANASNDFIANDASAWDGEWVTHYGGIDDPNDRCGFHPCGFTPKENPFYFALPYNDLDDRGRAKDSQNLVPWHDDTHSRGTILKNRWIEIVYEGAMCYAQWEDVGPNESDDFDYVFGDAKPRNTFGVRAGLDVSPAVRDCLGMQGNRETGWRFVEEGDVPEGPWKEIVTR